MVYSRPIRPRQRLHFGDWALFDTINTPLSKQWLSNVIQTKHQVSTRAFWTHRPQNTPAGQLKRQSLVPQCNANPWDTAKAEKQLECPTDSPELEHAQRLLFCNAMVRPILWLLYTCTSMWIYCMGSLVTRLKKKPVAWCIWSAFFQWNLHSIWDVPHGALLTCDSQVVKFDSTHFVNNAWRRKELGRNVTKENIFFFCSRSTTQLHNVIF